MTTRKRIRSLNPSVGGGGGGGPSPGGTIEWLPGDDKVPMTTASAVDMPSLGLVGALGSGASVNIPSLGLTGALSAGSAVAVPTLGLTGAMTSGAALAGSYTVTNKLPDEDTYLDENVPTTAHGTATGLLCKLNTALGQNEQKGHIAWDLTGFSGTVTSATFDVEISTTAGLGETASLLIYTSATKPFEEDTATWNNSEPPPGTLRETITQAVTTTPTIYTKTLGAASRTNMPGNWIYIRCIGTTALGLATITLTSKEGTNKPKLTWSATI